MFKILYKGGSLDWITNESAKHVLNQVTGNPRLLSRNGGIDQNELRTRFFRSGSQTLDLLESMLSLNPQERVSSNEALGHQLFKDFEDFRSEKIADFRIDGNYEKKLTSEASLRSKYTTFSPFHTHSHSHKKQRKCIKPL